MGDEVDPVLHKKVKQTQEILGNFIRRPPLTEKHLMKPPFRFIHDIIMSVVDSTGFLHGLYEGSELDASTITTRETKTAFMQKLIDALRLTTGEEVDVKISKILAGQEPAKTNDLLLSLGNALTKNLNSDKAVQSINEKEVSPPKPKGPGEMTKDPKKKNPAAAAAKMKENSPYSTATNKKTTKAPSRASKNPEELRKSKAADTPVGNKAPSRQSKAPAALSSSPPKGQGGPKTQSRQGGAGAGPNKASRSTDKSPTKKGPAAAAPGSSEKGKRPGGRGSIDEGPPSLGEGDAGNDEVVVVGSASASRRGSVSSTTAGGAVASGSGGASRESRSTSKYGGGRQQRGGTSETDMTSSSSSSRPHPGTFASPEAHADDAEQAEFIGELEFLMKKHGYEGDVGHDDDADDDIELNHNENDPNQNHDDDDDENENDDVEEEKIENLNNNVPGSNIKENVSRKNSNDNNNTSGFGTREEYEIIDTNLNETVVISPSPPSPVADPDPDPDPEPVSPPSPPPPKQPPPSQKHRKSAAPNNARTKLKTAGTEKLIRSSSSRDVSPSISTSALSLSNSALGPLTPPHMPSSSSSSSLAHSSRLLPDINERPSTTTTNRPPSARPHTSQMRSGGPATIGASIPRPPSARPAPPRPKTALIPEKEENVFRPTTAKVANVLLDAEEAADDDNYIVHEVAPPEPPTDLSDEVNGGELGLNGNLLMEENIDSILDPSQRGLLVDQILDSQNKLEDGSRLAKKTDIDRDSIMGDKERMRLREVTSAEVDKLKNLMQLMARNANPLGKLMDFVQEDVDAMQRDLVKWREESRKLDTALELAQEETEQSLEPLRRRMAELDELINDRQDSIAATKMSIYRQEERIRKVLAGLDRVKPRTGSSNEPKITSADLNFDFNSGTSDGNKVYFKKTNSASVNLSSSPA